MFWNKWNERHVTTLSHHMKVSLSGLRPWSELHVQKKTWCHKQHVVFAEVNTALAQSRILQWRFVIKMPIKTKRQQNAEANRGVWETLLPYSDVKTSVQGIYANVNTHWMSKVRNHRINFTHSVVYLLCICVAEPKVKNYVLTMFSCCLSCTILFSGECMKGSPTMCPVKTERIFIICLSL